MKPPHPHFYLALLLACCCLLASGTLAATAGEEGDTGAGSAPGASLLRKFRGEWGGHLKTRGSVSRPPEGSLLRSPGSRTHEDARFDLRVKSRVPLGDRALFAAHYEMLGSAGDTRRRSAELLQRFPGLAGQGWVPAAALEDDRRVMDLTKALDESRGGLLYHRLDRLYLALYPRWGSLTLGRQAVTWGNGLIFNPMDLFNPFAPTDIERDYKIGDDMVSLEFSAGRAGSCQVLWVPRRDPLNGDLTREQSSLAGKLHGALGSLEYDVMLGTHYQDTVLGLGWTGYLGGAAWRLDGVYTLFKEDGRKDGFLALSANLDYSWVWGGKNFYGFLEFYSNTLGFSSYSQALQDPQLLGRLSRGELFTLGRYYLAGHIRAELHPLFNVFLTAISNLEDPSGVLQPRAVWDMTRELQVTLGANLFFGDAGAEYGGFDIPGTDFLNQPARDAFLWLTLFF